MMNQDRNKAALHELQLQQAIIRDRVRGVASRHAPGFYLYGRAGTSKTYTVRKTLDDLAARYVYQDGHLTPLGLFDMLSEHPDGTIVLDDVSSLFQERIGLQILLAALGKQRDSTAARPVKYRRQGKEHTIDFSGGIIAISNLELRGSPALDALRSRIHCLKYDPTDEQIAALMRGLAKLGWPTSSPLVMPEECAEVAEFVVAESQRSGVRLDMRVLLDKALPDYLQHRGGETETHWKDLVLATLNERTTTLKHTPRIIGRDERKQIEQKIAQRIRHQQSSVQEQLEEWHDETGKSDRAFWRRLREIEGTGDELTE